jgi:hypothetical protein
MSQIKTKNLHRLPLSLVGALMLGFSKIAGAQSLISTSTTPGTPTTALEGMVGSNVVIAMFAVSLLVIGSVIAFKMDKSL